MKIEKIKETGFAIFTSILFVLFILILIKQDDYFFYDQFYKLIINKMYMYNM